jgi:hypothetical protein
MMHADIAGDWQAVMLRSLNQAHASSRRNPGQMHAAASITDQLDYGGNGDGFGGDRDTSQAKTAGNFAFMRDAIA